MKTKFRIGLSVGLTLCVSLLLTKPLLVQAATDDAGCIADAQALFAADMATITEGDANYDADVLAANEAYETAVADCEASDTSGVTITASTDPEESKLPSFTYSIVPVTCQNKTGGCSLCDIGIIIINTANIIAALLSAIALLMFILGGFFWIISDGNEQRIETGKKILIGTVMGLAVIFMAWLVVNLVVRYSYQASVGKDTISSTGDFKIFGTSWWSALAKCSPTVTPCVGKYIGDACGGSGACPAGTEGCSCYRPTNPKGDNNQCGGEADASAVAEAYQTGLEACYCAIGCELFEANKAKSSGAYASYTWQCVSQTNYDRSPTEYIKAPVDVTCAAPNMVCAADVP